jgi:hypothetical protein
MPTEIDILKELFDEKFKGIHLQLDAEFRVLNSRMTTQDVELAYVKAQTTKTNGRVTELEKTVHLVELDENKHILNCPQKEVLERIDKKIDEKKADTEAQFKELNVDLREYRFFKKYPKIAIGVFAFASLVMVIGTYITIKKLDLQGKDIKDNNIVSKRTNSILEGDSVRIQLINTNTKNIDSLLINK